MIDSDTSVVAVDFDAAKHAQMKKQFFEKQPVEYTYEYYSEGFILIDYVVHIKNDSILSITNKVSDTEPNVETIPQIFDFIEQVYTVNNNIEKKDVHTVAIHVTYHPDYFFPLEWRYTQEVAKGFSSDGNSSFSIKNFTVIEK